MNANQHRSAIRTPQAANPFLFVGGCPRSGTTLLQRMLDHHPHLAVANDAHFIPRVLEIHAPESIEAAKRGDAIPLSQRLIDGTWDYHRFYRMGLSRSEVDHAAESADSYQGFVRNLFTVYAAQRGKQLAGEKTPDYIRQLPLLIGLFPATKFIHIVRDGRDTALSLLNWATPEKGPGRLAYWNQDPVAVTALWWRQFVECDAEGQQLANRSDGYHLIRYEDLIQDPGDSLRQLCSFMNLPFDEAMLRFHQGKEIRAHANSAKSQWLPATKGLRNWRNQMSEEDQAVFEGLAGDALRTFGYPSTTAPGDSNAQRRIAAANEWWSAPGNKRHAAKSGKLSPSSTPSEVGAEHLTHADQQLIARDCQLGNLGTLLAADQFAKWIASHAEQLQLSTEIRLRADYVRYKPGTNCLVRYADERGNPWGFAVAYSDEAAEKLVKKRHTTDDCSVPDHFLLVDQDRRIALFRFPLDPDLPQLAEFFDGSMMDDPKAEAKLPVVSSLVSDWQVLTYKPQRRCVIQISQAGDPLATLRLYNKQDFAAAEVTAKHLSSCPWYGAARMAVLNGYRAVALRWIPGPSLDEFELGLEALAHTRSAGSLLGQVQRSAHSKLAIVSIDDLIGSCADSVELVKHLVPQHADWIEQIAGRAYRQLTEIVPRMALCHGDFHTGQIIVQPDKVQFLDWDAACNAPIGLDFASFAAHHIVERIAHGESDTHACEAIAALCDGYQEQIVGDTGRGLPINLDAYIVLGLLRMAPTPFRLRHPEWDREVEQILQAADARSCSCQMTRTVHRSTVVSEEFPATNQRSSKRSANGAIRAEHWFADALDPACIEAHAQPLVHRCIPDAHQLALELATPIHLKPDRRCVIQYDFQVFDKDGNESIHRVLGKTQQKSLRLTAYDAQLRLNEVLSTQLETALLVPRPLGIIPQWNMWLQEYLVGTRADELIAPGVNLHVSDQIGRSLAYLHNIKLPTERWHTFDDEFAILDDALRAVETIDPGRVDSLLNACRRLLDSIPENCLTGIHRDFYAAQVICSDNVGIVDFDLFSWGAAAIDVGNFIAHLKETALRRFGSHAALEQHETQFLNSYLENSPDVSRKSIDVLTVTSLARHVAISQRIKPRKVWTLPILTVCEALATQVSDRWHHIPCPSA